MLSRIAVARRAPRAFAIPARLYSDSRKEGSVAQDKGFSAREQAQEKKFVHDKEAQQIAALREQLKAQQQTIDDLAKKVAEKDGKQ